MGPQEKIVLHKKGILHVSCRVVLRKVEGFEIVIVELYFRAFRNQESQSRKNIGYLLDDQGDRMLCSHRTPSPRKGHIYPLVFELVLLELFLEGKGPLFESGFKAVPDRVYNLSDKRPLLGSKRADPFHYCGKFALLAEKPDFEGLKLLFASDICKL